jgi:hypothetical protein
MILVSVRCKVCRRLLDEVVDAPARDHEWNSYLYLHICQRHGDGGGSGNVAAWQARQRRAGKPTNEVRLGQWVRWSELRTAVERARRTGKTTNITR